jgi:upstream activation factor subunit UAF30
MAGITIRAGGDQERNAGSRGRTRTPHINQPLMERFKMATAKKAPAKKAAAKKAAPAKKAAAKKAAPAKAPAKKAAAKRAPNAAFMKAMTPSPQLAAVIGDKPAPRTEVTKKVWEYIKKNGLQDKNQKTMINADAKLKEIFKKPQVSMFEMTKLINGHLS